MFHHHQTWSTLLRRVSALSYIDMKVQMSPVGKMQHIPLLNTCESLAIGSSCKCYSVIALRVASANLQPCEHLSGSRGTYSGGDSQPIPHFSLPRMSHNARSRNSWTTSGGPFDFTQQRSARCQNPTCKLVLLLRQDPSL